ncbi:MAG: potassium transporter [Bacteroidales bacterium]|jgi:potassium uptake TrkH family protein|nr:potassium transporter [Bacteroidales bacterium]
MEQLKRYWIRIKFLFINLQKILLYFTRTVFSLLALSALLLIIYEFGFDLDISRHLSVRRFYYLILTLFFIKYSVNLIKEFKEILKRKGFWIGILIYLLLLITLIIHYFSDHGVSGHFFVQIFTSSIMMYALLLIFSMLELSQRLLGIMDKHIPPGLLFAYSFIFIIILGTVMLILPRSTVSGISLVDALFTATSAVCVTGLNVLSISSDFTLTGQVILLILIQIGGIGVMTFTSFFALSWMGHSSFQNNLVLKDMLNEENLSGIFRTLMSIMITTFGIELIGAVLVFFSIKGTLGMGFGEEVFFSFFHAISAFCNAGFSTLSGNLVDPLVSTNYRLHTLIALLIVFGGLGFPIIANCYRWVGYFVHNIWLRLTGEKKKQIHTKIIYINTKIALYSTVILLVLGFACYMILEYNHTLKGLSWDGKLATAFFGAVTPRTAGFNTVNLTAMMPATVLLTIILMWIGASPMSTGGGIKTTTFAIACMNIFNVARGKKKMEVFRREISHTTIRRAFAVIAISILWIVLSVFCISMAESQVELTAVFFECVSALGTVGLTLNLTPELGNFSKMVLVFTMFIGRVGALTILSGLMPQYSDKKYTYPQELVMVG